MRLIPISSLVVEIRTVVRTIMQKKLIYKLSIIIPWYGGSLEIKLTIPAKRLFDLNLILDYFSYVLIIIVDL